MEERNIRRSEPLATVSPASPAVELPRTERIPTQERSGAGPTEPVTESLPRRRQEFLLRRPGFAPLAPIVGWLVAWGAASLAAACVVAAGVELGLGLGFATGGVGIDDGLGAGIWLLVIQAGAFLLGGYAAARMARAHGVLHAAAVWLLAMLATGADAVVQTVRDGGESPLAQLGIPYWVGTGFEDDAAFVGALAIFAGVSLVAAIIGGIMGQAANRAAMREVRVEESATHPSAA